MRDEKNRPAWTEGQPFAEMPKNPLFQDLTGRVYGRLTVTEYTGAVGANHKWRCSCECGVTKEVYGSALKSGATKSCGCLHKEVAKERWTTHGNARDPLYQLWRGMVDRCTRPGSTGYDNYAGRGIAVAEEFLEFQAFKQYVLEHLGERPNRQYTLDRIDNSAGYERGNLRWATKKQQSRNTRTNRIVEYLGVEMTLVEACEQAGILETTAGERLKRGWDPAKALCTPVRRRAIRGGSQP
jgi:hypothetical protein